MKKRNKKNKLVLLMVIIFILIFVFLLFFYKKNDKNNNKNNNTAPSTVSYSLDNIPPYFGENYLLLYNNKPSFEEKDYQSVSFEYYSDLDNLNRCQSTFANIGKDIMPTEKRKGIGKVYPSGWKQAKYDIINGKYLFNRCHLIGYQLTGENDNVKNLITCTKKANVNVMLPFENKVADYVEKTNNHVLYRVTPIFNGDNLLASGIQIEASSVEDYCKDICFNIYIYNVQDGIEIDYANGNSHLMTTKVS
ncbi:MAG: DNA/RNA non-specific endonuclease [Bacilli bacterium]